MFVYRRQDLPPDPDFPADLEKLGYFVNERDQIRKIRAPARDFQFKINRNPRWNEAQREAMNECIRKIVVSRLQALGLDVLRLPLSAAPADPHVPIMASSSMARASRIVVVFGEPVQDLGVWAYRSVGRMGIGAGSAVAFAAAVLQPTAAVDAAVDAADTHGSSPAAVLLANTGQLIWHSGRRRAVTNASWMAMPRRSAVDPPPRLTGRNRIAGHEGWQQHVDAVFNEILAARGRLVSPNARIDVIGLAEGGLAVMRYLARNCK